MAVRTLTRASWAIRRGNRPQPSPPVNQMPKPIIPRLIRFHEAPRYLGMDRNRFNAEVRPLLTEIRIGRQGVAFDRLELDSRVDEYIARNGRPRRWKGVKSWDARRCRASSSEVMFGRSTSTSRRIRVPGLNLGRAIMLPLDCNSAGAHPIARGIARGEALAVNVCITREQEDIALSLMIALGMIIFEEFVQRPPQG